jgi:hypothetical protein
MAKIKVTPNRENVPPHPVDGPIRPEGSMWTADQYTFRLIRDGDITEVVEDPGVGVEQPETGDPGKTPKVEHREGEDPPDPKRKK